MAYQVIARKWRPQRFDDVTGQEAITRTLQNAIEQQRLHHAYLFAGARGVGKTTTARLLAKALNCVNGPTIEPCNVCASCTEIASGISMDVHEIDAASNTGIDNVREVIINTVAISPARDRYKIFIIDEVHMLSNSAFNALLKTLEEPPSHVVFIMATTELHKVPETILSRCQQFEFRTIPAQKTFNRLQLIAREEGITISPTGLNLIVRAGEGSMRDAQSAFDQVISFAGKEIKDEDVVAALGIIGPQTLNAFVEAVAQRDVKDILTQVDSLVSRGYDLRNFAKELMGHFRNLLVVRTVGFDRELVTATDDEGEELHRLSEYFSEEDLIRCFNVLTKVEQDIKASTQERFQLELGLIKLAQMVRLSSLEELLQRVKRLESSLGGKTDGGSAPPQRSISSTSAPVPPTRPAKVEAQPVKSEPAVVQVKTNPDRPQQQAVPEWEPPPEPELAEPVNRSKYPPPSNPSAIEQKIREVLDARKKLRVLHAFEAAENVELDDNDLRISFGTQAKTLAEQLQSKDTTKLLSEIASEVIGRKVSVIVQIGAARRASSPSPVPAPTSPVGGETASAPEKPTKEGQKGSPRQRAEENPIVQAFVKTFQGKITDVKAPE